MLFSGLLRVYALLMEKRLLQAGQKNFAASSCSGSVVARETAGASVGPAARRPKRAGRNPQVRRTSLAALRARPFTLHAGPFNGVRPRATLRRAPVAFWLRWLKHLQILDAGLRRRTSVLQKELGDAALLPQTSSLHARTAALGS